MQRILLFAILGLTVGVVLAVAYLGRNSSEPEPDPAPAPVAQPAAVAALPSGAYVGSKVCRDCHAAICDVYATTHGMARSLAAVADAKPIEDYEQTAFQTADHREYSVDRREQDVEHHEALRDLDGQVLYDEMVPVAYAIGSGGRGRGYLIERDGRLYQSPISWYTQTDRWALSPGYQPGSHSRFQFRITEDCLYCHAGRISVRGVGTQHFADPPFLEASIGCERCHGPAGEHVENQRKGVSDSSLVKIGELSAERRDAVCWQCHLRATLSVPLSGQSLYDFRPGQRLHDNRLVVTDNAGAQGDDTSGKSTVVQLMTSRCYVESQGRLACISCHDPHKRLPPAQRADWYQDRCNQCHQDRGCSLPEPERQAEPALGSCIACHMPSNATATIPHTAITDHRILRRYADAPEDRPRAGDPREVVFFGEVKGAVDESELHRGRGIALATRGIASGDPALVRAAISELDPLGTAHTGRDILVLEHVGICYMIAGMPQQGLACWSRLLELMPQHESALRSMAIVASTRGDGPGFLKYVDRLIEANPDLPEPYFMRARALQMLERVDEAIAAAEAALERDPTALPVRLWLISACESAGQIETAQQQRAKVEAFLRTLNSPPPTPPTP